MVMTSLKICYFSFNNSFSGKQFKALFLQPGDMLGIEGFQPKDDFLPPQNLLLLNK